MEPGVWKLDGKNSGKAEVLMSVIDRYLVLLTDTSRQNGRGQMAGLAPNVSPPAGGIQSATSATNS